MSKRPLLLGHRGAGAGGSPPENTIESFDACLHHGCDGFEFDVRLSGWGGAVIGHDPEVAGVTVASAREEELRGVPQLRDVFRGYSSRAFLDVELKTPGLASILLASLSENPPEKSYVVSSFLVEVLEDLRLHSETISLGLLCSKKAELTRWRQLPVQYVIPHHSLIDAGLIRDIRAAGKSSLVWTVNDRDSMLRLADWGVDGIISDKTEMMVRTFRSG